MNENLHGQAERWLTVKLKTLPGLYKWSGIFGSARSTLPGVKSNHKCMVINNSWLLSLVVRKQELFLQILS